MTRIPVQIYHMYLRNLPAIILIAGSDVPIVLVAVTDNVVIIDKSVMKLTLAVLVTLSVLTITAHVALSVQLIVTV